MQPSWAESKVSGALPGHSLQKSFCDTDNTTTNKARCGGTAATPAHRRWRQEEEISRPSALYSKT